MGALFIGDLEDLLEKAAIHELLPDLLLFVSKDPLGV